MTVPILSSAVVSNAATQSVEKVVHPERFYLQEAHTEEDLLERVNRLVPPGTEAAVSIERLQSAGATCQRRSDTDLVREGGNDVPDDSKDSSVPNDFFVPGDWAQIAPKKYGPRPPAPKAAIDCYHHENQIVCVVVRYISQGLDGDDKITWNAVRKSWTCL
jgi:hypothetical protein